MTFFSALRAAADTPYPDRYIERIKDVVRGEMYRLDPNAELVDTSYFNHSAIPDFEIVWRDSKEDSRPLFIRDSYASFLYGEDASHLSAPDPVVLTMTGPDAEPGTPVESVRHEATKKPQMLVTDPAAFEEFQARREGDTPVNDLLRANFVRGARGLVDERLANLLVSDDWQDTSSRGSVISEVFEESAAFRIERTAQITDLARGLGIEGISLAMSGQLSTAEIVHLLPWVLSQPRDAISPLFWYQLASMLTFSDLEATRDALQGVNISPLVAASADSWQLTRAYVGLSTPIEGEADVDRRRNYWSFQAGALGIDLGHRRLMVSRDGRILKKRPGTSSALWENIFPLLEGYSLQHVRLSGLARSITVSAEQSPDIRADVDEVTQTVEDTYYLRDLSLTFSTPDSRDGHVAEVLFGEGLVVAESGISLRDLARTALGVLDYRDPLGRDEVDGLIAGD